MLTVEQLRENYKRLDDFKISELASQEAASLTPEAIIVLKEEIKNRGLSKELFKSVEVQTKELSLSEFNDYCAIVQKQPCPICGSNSEPLNGTISKKVVSVIVFTTSKSEIKIACPTCLDDANNSASTKAGLLGWWAIPWGIVRTIQALRFNNKMSESNHDFVPNETLKGFVLGNFGAIELAKNSPEKMKQLLTNFKV